MRQIESFTANCYAIELVNYVNSFSDSNLKKGLNVCTEHCLITFLFILIEDLY